eukprot:TRINITY_DN14745_c0_g1_i3.p1 TRINITY_DN14745_c0_g1~~TRINITY_DN14745_c0_g1_i3.p1  ORF type:complete len:884 (+),score=151.85 TRINITY_DN14745_c0_g1_i3:41-2692(+)
MPMHPALAGRRLWSPRAETPRKIWRPAKRRRQRTGLRPRLTASQELPDRAACAVPAETWAWAGSASEHGSMLMELAMAESLALLEAPDILQGAAACRSWRDTVQCRTFWRLAEPRLGVADRIIQKLQICTRRSRGTLFKGVLLGEKRQAVALRSVNVRSANANKDDGLLPSVVREVAYLQSLGRAKHPGIVRFIGAQASGDFFHIVTEFVGSSFADWFSCRPRPPLPRLQKDIQDRFGQLLACVAFLHARGIIHRNLVPSNVLIDPSTGTVKLCDLAFGRALDEPLRPYSPEDQKLRESSSREARRLCYKAPEMVLRQEVYGAAVDVWSVGCLLAEAVLGQPIFHASQEIDYLFQVFRLLGTPGTDTWPEAMALPLFSPKFPLYTPIDLRRAAKAVRNPEEAAALTEATDKARHPLLKSAMTLGKVLGVTGITLLIRLLCLDPAKRCSAEAALRSNFLDTCPSVSSAMPSQGHPGASHSQTRYRATKRQAASPASSPPPSSNSRIMPPCSQDSLPPPTQLTRCSQETTFSQQEASTPGSAMARSLGRFNLGTPPSTRARVVVSPSGDALLPHLWAAMVRQVEACREEFKGMLMASGEVAFGEDILQIRACGVNRLMHFAQGLPLSANTLHLGVALLDEHLQLATPSQVLQDPDLAAVACLKLADSINELSNEYFARDKTEAYVMFSRNRWRVHQVVTAEKEMVQRLQFRLLRPTAAWFLRSCLDVGGRELREAAVVDLAKYLLDLCLLDWELQAHLPQVQAQVALLLAVYAVGDLARPPVGSCADRQSHSNLNLRPWASVRAATCWSNTRDLVQPCFSRMVRVVQVLRHNWRKQKLTWVDRIHPAASKRELPKVYPPELIEELLPPPPMPFMAPPTALLAAGA